MGSMGSCLALCWTLPFLQYFPLFVPCVFSQVKQQSKKFKNFGKWSDLKKKNSSARKKLSSWKEEISGERDGFH